MTSLPPRPRGRIAWGLNESQSLFAAASRRTSPLSNSTLDRKAAPCFVFRAGAENPARVLITEATNPGADHHQRFEASFGYPSASRVAGGKCSTTSGTGFFFGKIREMKTSTPGGTPAKNPRVKKSTGLIGKSHHPRATASLELETQNLSEGSRRLIQARATAWACTPGEAATRILEESVAMHRAPAITRKSVTCEVDLELWEEVRELLLSPDGIAVFGLVPLEQRFRGIVASWLRDVTCAFTRGSGYRRAAGLPPHQKVKPDMISIAPAEVPVNSSRASSAEKSTREGGRA